MNSLDSVSIRQYRWPAQCTFWALLLLASGAPRVLAALFLPNEEGDPYSYLQSIQIMRASLVGGTFTISELFGFWLPMYQFICALISALVGHPLYVAKLVTAAAGTGVCLLLFGVSLQLTANRLVSLVAFALVAFNPIHIMYSAFSMSDVPHAFVVMSSLYFVINDRWVPAAGLVAVGGLTRPESWLFIALLPALQWLRHRRVSAIAFFITLSSPLLWIYISWAATGNPLEYFKARNDYITELLSGDPGLAHFSALIVVTDMRTLFYSTGPAVIVSCFMAAWFLVKTSDQRTSQQTTESFSRVAVTIAYFFCSLGFLLFAYFTKNQPTIFARYCLVPYSLGLPVLAWTLVATRRWKRPRARAVSMLLLGLCLFQFSFQLRDGLVFVGQVSQKRIVANYLRDNFEPGSGLKVFCDDDTVKILAGIPSESFVSSASLAGDSEAFLDELKANRVEYLVYERRDRSAAVALFRDLGEERIKDHFQLVESTNIELRLYRTVF